MKFLRTVSAAVMFVSALLGLTACATSKPGNAFFLGEWTRTDPFGENQTSMTSWTFRENGTLTRDGYPPFSAEARYTIRTAEENKAVLRLQEKQGPQSDALPDELEVILNPETATLSVDGSAPLSRR